MSGKLFVGPLCLLGFGTVVLAETKVEVTSATTTPGMMGSTKIEIKGKLTLDKDHTFLGFDQRLYDPKDVRVNAFLSEFTAPDPGKTTTFTYYATVFATGKYKAEPVMNYAIGGTQAVKGPDEATIVEVK